jgi:3-oxoacyl-[acyl-carrier protein] reductase
VNLGIHNKVALVTAASRGLGLAVALELAQEGCKLVVCSRSHEAIQRAADDIHQKTGAEVLALAADVADAQHIAQLVAQAEGHFGRLDILFANAGGPPTAQFAQLSDEQWQTAVNVNLMSVVRLCRAVLPAMQRNRWGRIVIDTSCSVKQPIDNLILSNSIRSAVTGLAKTLSGEVAKDNITVNCVCPGYTLTERVHHVVADRAQRGGISWEQAAAGITGTIPLGRFATVAEFAAPAVFLMSERAGYITGVSLTVDGGWTKGLFG